MASLTAKSRARGAQAGKALRSACCAALLLVIAAGESTGCGSKSDLVIGRNTSSGVPGASGGTAGNASGGGGGTLGDAAPEAAPDAGPDALPPDATPPDAQPDSAEPDCSGFDAGPPTSLLHRYSFDGTGTVAKDSVGSADGQVEPGGTLAGGVLTLDGLTGYVNLPNHLLSVLSDATFVVWVTWLGGAGYERIFDFGVGVGEDDTSGQGVSYVAASPFGGDANLQMLVRQNASQPEIPITSAVSILNAEHQVAVVFASQSYAELYCDGQFLGRTPIPFALSDVNDVNDWIGRSQWVDDHTFSGTVDELRIYGEALSPCAIAALNEAGPNAL